MVATRCTRLWVIAWFSRPVLRPYARRGLRSPRVDGGDPPHPASCDCSASSSARFAGRMPGVGFAIATGFTQETQAAPGSGVIAWFPARFAAALVSRAVHEKA